MQALVERPNLVITRISFLPRKGAETITEERNVSHVTMSVIQNEFHDILFARYSSFSKPRRVTAFCLRYLQPLRARVVLRRTDADRYHQLSIRNDTVSPVSTDELQRAKLHLCRLAQQQSFPAEISHLSSGEPVIKSSAMKWLKPYIDEYRIIRVGGRLRNATVSDYVKHPIVLSAKHPLSTLLQTHTSLVDLPASRVSPTRPFSVCGVDYCGPFLLKATVRNRAPTKAYVAIFGCFATRAVHIELVSDLTTAAFLAALRCVDARRGRISELHSDNATTFKGASHALNRMYRMLQVDNNDRDRIFNWCAENEIRWKFIPPRAPHIGGL
ncbi:uncharacterized protein LOC134223117 [Armigeres subalbatus]|uniref:uncharacterized protein LOC134223117 n=1 Tax=Armigeres subalbatus TaxID=124917 RepID=UPI002ED552E1